jgi:uncharacterized membrane protein YcaP (DUF421 family)
MNILIELFGVEQEVNPAQMALRALVIFFIAVCLVRISGRRSLGTHTAFDMIFNILLGAILSRAVVGASPFLGTVISCIVLAFLHRLFGLLAVFFPFIGSFIKGSTILLYDNRRFLKKNLLRAQVSKKDISEQIRLKMNGHPLDEIEKIYMERNGEMSFVKKQK